VNNEGPPLESLLRRLTETPQDFLAEPRVGEKGQIAVSAVIGDVFRLYRLVPDRVALELGAAEDNATERNRLAAILLLCWFVSDETFRGRTVSCDVLLTLFKETAGELAEQGTPAKFVYDPHRREELVRLALARLDLRP